MHFHFPILFQVVGNYYADSAYPEATKSNLCCYKNPVITVFRKQQYADSLMEQINDDQVLYSFIS